MNEPASDSNSTTPSEVDRTFHASGRSPIAWTTLLVVLGSGLTIDLWSKAWAFRNVARQPVELLYEEVAGNPSYRLPWHDGVRALGWDLLDFRLVLNHGAVFGVGQNRQRLFIGFTLIALVVAVFFFAKWTRSTARLAHVAIAMIMAGGLGNLYDRVRFGAVRDFLHMFPRWELPFGWRWPGNATTEVFPWVFNVADMLLLAGMGLFMIYAYRRDREEHAIQRAAAAKTSITAPSSDAVAGQ